MVDIFELAKWIGAILTILGFVVYLTRPIMSSFSKITENLTKMSHTLDLLNKDLEASKRG